MFWRLRTLVLGIILGLLFSPGAGQENRRRLWNWLQAQAGQAAPKVQSQFQQVATKGATVASQTLDQARQQVGPVAQRAQDTLGTIGKNVQQQAGQTAQQVTGRVADTADQIRNQAPAAAQQAQHQVGKVADAVTDRVSDAATQASEQVQQPDNAGQPAGPAPSGSNPIPPTTSTPGTGLTAAEESPKNVLREVDRARAKAEEGKL